MSKQFGAWVRHERTGELGRMVNDGGFWSVELDRKDQKIRRKYKETDWRILDESPKRHRLEDVVQVAYMADLALRRILGDRDTKAAFNQLSAAKQAAWRTDGPKKPEVRAKLYAAIMSALSDLHD